MAQPPYRPQGAGGYNPLNPEQNAPGPRPAFISNPLEEPPADWNTPPDRSIEWPPVVFLSPSPPPPPPPPAPPAPPQPQAPPLLLAPPPPPAARINNNQNHITNRVQNASGYGHLIRNSPPVNVCPLPGKDIGMLEICTFFPNWFQIPDVVVRAFINGWTRKDIAKAQLWAMNVLTVANLKTVEERVQKQISQGGKLWYGLEEGRDRWHTGDYLGNLLPEDNLTAGQWQLRGDYGEEQSDNPMVFGHFKLLDIANVVARWPNAPDRLWLTHCLEFALLYPHLDLDTSHFTWIIQNHGQNWNIPINLNAQHDRNARDWVRANIQDP